MKVHTLKISRVGEGCRYHGQHQSTGKSMSQVEIEKLLKLHSLETAPRGIIPQV